MIKEVIEQAKQSGTSWIEAADAFKLHDTYGFPYDLTKELLAEQGLSVDDQGFEELMEEQRSRARMGVASAHGSEDRHGKVIAFAASAAPTRFVGYETLRATTGVSAAQGENGRVLVKLEESPFYAEGGGQVADSGVLRWDGGEAGVADVYRIGDDQAIEIAPDTSSQGATATGDPSSARMRPGVSGSREGPESGSRVEAIVDRETRHATMRNHTATHLLHAALREQLGTHVRQAGSAVRPDKLRFDFTHGHPLDAEELAAIEGRINEWVKASRPVRWMNMDRAEAERLGAMALFGEKYGDWVRVVEVEDISRELCGGTHVANTAEVGIFKIVGEGSSAANVRRIEALTGPAAIDWFRERATQLREAGRLLGSPQDPLAGARRAAERLEALSKGAEQAEKEMLGDTAKRLAESSEEVAGVKLVAGEAPVADQKQLLAMADRVRQSLGEAAVVLGGAADGQVGIVACFAPGVVERGLSAAEVVREAAAVVGGGGGGRDDVAQAGGKDPAMLADALEAAKRAIERKLAS
jgi:alanyl-tRNA synthetase